MYIYLLIQKILTYSVSLSVYLLLWSRLQAIITGLVQREVIIYMSNVPSGLDNSLIHKATILVNRSKLTAMYRLS
jgi:hypothetical protein